MDIEQLRATWEELGESDPLWAVLSIPGKEHGRWSVDEFFETGRRDVAAVMETLSSMARPKETSRCLDFGCGVGRLTQAFCEHFDHVDGVDIARSMIDLARGYNKYGERCTYHVNERDDLALFADATFDLVYTRIVLMHIPPTYGLRYVREFVRVLKPGGIAIVQAPCARSQVRRVWVLGRKGVNRIREKLQHRWFGRRRAVSRNESVGQRSTANPAAGDAEKAEPPVAEQSTDRTALESVRRRFRRWLGLPAETHAMYVLPQRAVMSAVAVAGGRVARIERTRDESFLDATYYIVG